MSADSRHNRTIEDPISKLLATQRLKQNLSLDAVAAFVGVSVVTIHGWEQGMVSPSSLYRWSQWAKAVDANLEFRLTIPQDDVYVFPDGDKQ